MRLIKSKDCIAFYYTVALGFGQGFCTEFISTVISNFVREILCTLLSYYRGFNCKSRIAVLFLCTTINKFKTCIIEVFINDDSQLRSIYIVVLEL